MSTEATIADMISSAQQAAGEALDKAIDYTDAAQTAAIFGVSGSGATQVNVPLINVSNFTPYQDLGAAYQTIYDNMVGTLGPEWDTMFNDFVNRFFPMFEVNSAAAEQWCNDVISGTNSGMPATAEAAMWSRGRDRALKEAARLEDQAVSDFAARGFAMPPGALTAKLQEVRQGVADKVGDLNRDIMVEQIKATMENVRFAVDQLMKDRYKVFEALFDYLNSYFKLYEIADKRATTYATVSRQLWEASATYYRTLVDVEALKADISKFNSNIKQREFEATVQAAVGSADARTKAAVGGATALGNAAAAALSSLNTLASLAKSE